jgi:hypothetical protein
MVLRMGLLIAGSLMVAACGDTGTSRATESHQTTTMVHEAEPGTGGSGDAPANCDHDPSSQNPCLDAFIDLPGQDRNVGVGVGVGGSGKAGQ